MLHGYENWCGQGWSLRAYTWKGALYAKLYRGQGYRCPLGVLQFSNRAQLDLLVADLNATLTVVSDAREPGEIRVLDTQVPHLIPEVKVTA